MSTQFYKFVHKTRFFEGNKKESRVLNTAFFGRFILVGAKVGRFVTFYAFTKHIIVAGEDGIENNACQSGNGKFGEGDVSACYGEGNAVGKAEAADEDHSSDDQIAGFSEVHLIFHDVAHTYSGDHTVKDEGNTADDCSGDGVDQRIKLGGEGENDGVNGGNADYAGIVYTAESQYAGVFTVSGVGRTAEHAGKSGGNTTKQEIEAVTGSIDAQAKKVAELQKAWRAAATDSARDDYKKQIEEAQFELEKLEGKTSGIPGMNYGMGDLAGKGGSGLFQDPLFTQNTYDSDNWMSKAIAHKRWKLDDKAMGALGDEIAKSIDKTSIKEFLDTTTQEMGKMVSGISGLVGGLDKLGIEVPQGIQEAIGILEGITTILTAIQTISTLKFWSNGGVIHAASGMIVPGNHYSGDMVPSMINSGELILNRAQQGAVASQLQDNQRRAPQIPYVSGENIYAGLSNYLRRIGAGEIVTWRG